MLLKGGSTQPGSTRDIQWYSKRYALCDTSFWKNSNCSVELIIASVYLDLMHGDRWSFSEDM